ncbi:MAG: carboxylesterase family protein, partial [Betaproteobacteria bacterium]|nr:carboxylesterase family protein [Betaproteobacteria bacterium]
MAQSEFSVVTTLATPEPEIVPISPDDTTDTFAAPPVGPLRFRAPRPPYPRSGPLVATAFAPAPVQQPPAPGLYGPGPLPQSEDCLALNIWSPHGPGPHPVYVWI